MNCLPEHNMVLSSDGKMMGTRRANGQGYTYKNKTSYRTVIKRDGKVFTASGKTIQESRRNTRNKLEQENPNALPNTKKSKLTLQEFLNSWLENEHRHNISNGTYLRYESLSRIHISPQYGECIHRELQFEYL